MINDRLVKTELSFLYRVRQQHNIKYMVQQDKHEIKISLRILLIGTNLDSRSILCKFCQKQILCSLKYSIFESVLQEGDSIFENLKSICNYGVSMSNML